MDGASQQSKVPEWSDIPKAAPLLVLSSLSLAMNFAALAVNGDGAVARMYTFPALLSLTLICCAYLTYQYRAGRWRDRKELDVSHLFPIFGLSSASLFLAAGNLDPVDRGTGWGVVLLATVACVVVALTAVTRRATSSVVLVILLAFPWAYGAVHSVNAFYDDGPDSVFRARVAAVTRSKGGKSTRVTYHLALEPIGAPCIDRTLNTNVCYYKGQEVELRIRSGRLGIPWIRTFGLAPEVAKAPEAGPGASPPPPTPRHSAGQSKTAGQ